MLQPIQMKGEDVPFTIHPDHHRFRRKELGIVSIHLGTTVFPTCTFYEIIEPTTTNIIFNFFTNSSTFYCFPREALTECLTNSAPYKVVFSFLSQPSDQHVMLSNVSQELFQAIKNLVYPYETMCQNISALCKQHEEQVAHHRSEIAMLPETLYSNQSEKAHHDDSSTSISSCDDLYEKEKKKVKQDHRTGTKKCLYCGSKSTPMWRRGPQGAGTLCNACGVKWKHGKILNGNDTKPEKKRKRSNSKRKEDSSTSDSPMEFSPNTSPSDLQKTSYHMTYLMDYNGNDVLEDAVEAAALLTLLKRS